MKLKRGYAYISKRKEDLKTPESIAFVVDFDEDTVFFYMTVTNVLYKNTWSIKMFEANYIPNHIIEMEDKGMLENRYNQE